jgi:hypothetical protein
MSVNGPAVVYQMPMPIFWTPGIVSVVPQHSASIVTPIKPDARASQRLRSSWPLTPSSTSKRFGPISATGPDPTRSKRVAVSGSETHAASAEQIAHGIVVVAAPITPSCITRSPRTSEATRTTASSVSAAPTYGAASQFQLSSDTRADAIADRRA